MRLVLTTHLRHLVYSKLILHVQNVHFTYVPLYSCTLSTQPCAVTTHEYSLNMRELNRESANGPKSMRKIYSEKGPRKTLNGPIGARGRRCGQPCFTVQSNLI